MMLKFLLTIYLIITQNKYISLSKHILVVSLGRDMLNQDYTRTDLSQCSRCETLSV